MRIVRPRIVAPTRAQAMVEFVMTFVVFVFLVFVIVDFGRAIWYWTTISNAAREGTTLAVINSPDEGEQPDAALVRTRVLEKAIGVDLSDGDVTVTGCCSPNSLVTVSIVYDFAPVTPMISSLTGGPIELSASSSRRGEY